ncbi:hypothetical protein V1477_002422 [Vespula maculifrons]|uniref:Uncharacterized protein n=1 Tax=Vespula maculifrons TaxID=7453 RepID=A0ABD2CWL2_VESMC
MTEGPTFKSGPSNMASPPCSVGTLDRIMVGMRDTGYTVSTDAPASDTERDEAHIARQISHSLRVGKFNGGTPTNRDVAYKKLDQSTTSVSKCYPHHI